MKIALTFDIERDLPHILDTFNGIKKGLGKILNLLDNFNIKATFFCTGILAYKHASYIQLIESNGHEIASHGWNHERLSDLPYKKSYELIKKSKQVLQEICHNSEIIGFRAPYLSPPKNLFEILEDLGFSYDSSITSEKKAAILESKYETIREFIPSKRSGYFRFPLANKRLMKVQIDYEPLVLYFHPWEFLNMKTLMRNHSKSIFLKNLLFRPDRWINTGNSFEKKLSNLIDSFYSNKWDFIALSQIC